MFKKIMGKILLQLGVFLLWIMSILPMGVLKFLGDGLGLIGYKFAKKRRNVGIKNLSLCFPDMSQKKKEELIKNHFKCLMTAGLEYGKVFFGSKTTLRTLVEFKDEQYCFEYYGKRSVILLCPHFVGLDMLSIRLTIEVEGCSIYSEQKNSDVTKLVTQARNRFLSPNSKIFSRKESLRAVVKHMKDFVGVFYYLPDQDFGERDSIYTPFFAYPTCSTVSALPKIARLTDAVVVPVIVYRNSNNKYTAQFFKAWDNYPSGDLVADVHRMNKFIESVILKHKEEYFWLHKRFKTQPNVPRGSLYQNC